MSRPVPTINQSMDGLRICCLLPLTKSTTLPAISKEDGSMVVKESLPELHGSEEPIIASPNGISLNFPLGMTAITSLQRETDGVSSPQDRLRGGSLRNHFYEIQPGWMT